MLSFAMYIDSIFQHFSLDLDEYFSSFDTYELEAGIYTLNVFSEALFYILQPEYEIFNHSVDIECDDFTRKTKLFVRPGIIAIRFDEQSFIRTVLGFNPNWDFKQYKECLSQKFVNLSTTDKLQLEADVVDGSVVNGIREPILFSFVLEKPPGYEVFFEPETKHYKNITKSVLITITFLFRK